MHSNPSFGLPKKTDIKAEARDHIARAKAMIALIENDPEKAMTVKMSGLKIGLCNNEAFVELMNAEIAEAQKAIDGQENKFE